MSATNYFKVSAQRLVEPLGVDGVFPFDDGDVESTQRAYRAALKLRALNPRFELSVWARPVGRGEWDRVDVVGDVVRGDQFDVWH
jgi:hypothetical protein